MATSHPAWSYWSDATVLDDYAMTTTTVLWQVITVVAVTFEVHLQTSYMHYFITAAGREGVRTDIYD